MVVLKRILVATDFGEPAEVALRYGRELARTFGASLEVLHVCDKVIGRELGLDAVTIDDAKLQSEIEASAHKHLEALLDAEDRTMLKATPVLKISGARAQSIVEYAKESRADLIVMGTHGRGTMAHLLVGSVAERVVRTAPCPVLTVRHPEREFVLPEALVAAAKG